MKFKTSIKKIRTVEEISEYWTKADFIELLKKFNFQDTASIKESELKDFLFMAISDFEPNEAAEILMEYKLSERLTKGQMEQISHEMLKDKMSEEYPDISFHETFFHINQLLYKAYNGVFPLSKATIIDFELKQLQKGDITISEEVILKAFAPGLSERNIIIRLFEQQLKGDAEFLEAENIIWEVKNTGEHNYQIITSEYWLNKEDFTSQEIESTVVEHVVEQEE